MQNFQQSFLLYIQNFLLLTSSFCVFFSCSLFGLEIVALINHYGSSHFD